MMKIKNITLGSIVFLILSCDNDIDWNTYLGNQSRSHFSELKQIHAGNINLLELAWEYESGQIGKYTQIQCSPIVVDGVLYGTKFRVYERTMLYVVSRSHSKLL